MLKHLGAMILSMVAPVLALAAEPGNRLAWLDDPCNPYYVGLHAPRLVTPQWIGQQGVEAVVVLSNDDLRKTETHEAYLRPIIDRLKQIDGRGPISVMANHVDLDDPQLQKWLAEGVSVETHTVAHPCPCLQGGDFAKAKQTYDAAIDLVAQIPNVRMTAFRMPCCDSMNSVGPRFFAEMFGQTTPAGNFLQVDSSVFMAFTADDPTLPADLTTDEEGQPRFTKYIPRDRNFVNYVENYPYPYVVDRLCWEVPAAIPDDWLGFNLRGDHNPLTVRDMKAAIDAAVVKQGVFTLCFHPYRWIRNDQVVDMIDHTVGRHGAKVLFLNFHEVCERLSKNLLGGQPLRAANGADNGVRVLDVDGDGFMDVVIGNEHVRQTRLWSPQSKTWTICDFPAPIVDVAADGTRRSTGVRFGVLQPNGRASILVRNEQFAGVWHFDGMTWKAASDGLAGLDLDGPILTVRDGQDQGVRLRDLDLDGICEVIVGNPRHSAVFRWSAEDGAWTKATFSLPSNTAFVDAAGRDAGLRLVDLNADGHVDVIYSDAHRNSVHLFESMAAGWSRKILDTARTDAGPIPMIVRPDGTNNGAWFQYGHMFLQNEDTGKRLPNHIDTRSYEQLLSTE